MELNELEKEILPILQNDDVYNFIIKFLNASMVETNSMILDCLRKELPESVRYRLLGEFDLYDKCKAYLLTWRNGYLKRLEEEKNKKEEKDGGKD